MSRLDYLILEDQETRDRLLTIATKWMKSRLKKDGETHKRDKETARSRLRMSLWFRSEQFQRRTKYKAGIRFLLSMEDPNNFVLNTWWG